MFVCIYPQVSEIWEHISFMNPFCLKNALIWKDYYDMDFSVLVQTTSFLYVWKWSSLHISSSDSHWWRWKRKPTYHINFWTVFIYPILWPNIKGSNSIMVLDARIYNILRIERIWRNGKWHQRQMWRRINCFEQFISRVYGSKVLKEIPSFTCKSLS